MIIKINSNPNIVQEAMIGRLKSSKMYVGGKKFKIIWMELSRMDKKEKNKIKSMSLRKNYILINFHRAL